MEEVITIYAIEKRKGKNDNWDQACFYPEQEYDLAQIDYSTLKRHGYGQYRLRRLNVGGEWEWNFNILRDSAKENKKESTK